MCGKIASGERAILHIYTQAQNQNAEKKRYCSWML